MREQTIAISADSFALLLAGEPIRANVGGVVLSIVLEAGINYAVAMAAVNAGQSYLDRPRVEGGRASLNGARVIRNHTPEQVETMRAEAERTTGLKHHAWAEGNHWLLAPRIPHEAAILERTSVDG